MIKKYGIFLSLFSSLSLYSMNDQLTQDAIRKSFLTIAEALYDSGYILKKKSFISKHKCKFITVGTVVVAGLGTYLLMQHLNNVATSEDLEAMEKEATTSLNTMGDLLDRSSGSLQQQVLLISSDINNAHSKSTGVYKSSQELLMQSKQIDEETKSFCENAQKTDAYYSDELKTMREQAEEDFATMNSFLIRSNQSLSKKFNKNNGLLDTITLQQKQTNALVKETAQEVDATEKREREHAGALMNMFNFLCTTNTSMENLLKETEQLEIQ